MIDKFFKLLLDKENLKTNGLVIIVIITLGALIGGGWSYFKLTSNHLNHNTEAILKQAVTNEKIAGAINNFTETQQENTKFLRTIFNRP